MSRLKELRRGILLGFYISISLVFILPIWLTKIFITFQGPATEYKSKILSELLFSKNDSTSIFELNYNPSVNFLVEIIYAFLGGLLKPDILHKLVYTIWISAFLLLLKLISNRLNDSAYYRPFLVFPLLFSSIFILGYENFLFSIVVVLWGLYELLQIESKNRNKYIFFFKWLFISLLAFASHLLGFLILLVAQLAFLLFHPKKQKLKEFYPALIISFLLAIPLLYFNIIGSQEAYSNSFSDLLISAENWISLSFLVSFSSLEQTITWVLSLVFHGLFIYAIYRLFKLSDTMSNMLFWFKLYLGLSIASFLAFFIFQPYCFGMQNIQEKFQLLSLLFLVLSLCCIRMNRNLLLGLSSVAVLISFIHLKQRFIVWQKLGEDAESYLSVIEHIPAGATIYAFNNSGNNSHRFFPALIGSRKDVNIMNYDFFESLNSSFSVVKNTSLMREFNHSESTLFERLVQSNQEPEFIYNIGNQDNLNNALLKSRYKWMLTWENPNIQAQLYKRK